MDSSVIKGNGSGIVADTEFQLLNPVGLGSGSFWYDFYLVGEDASADAIWQLWDEAGITDYADMTGAAGVSGDGDVEWLRRIEVDANSLGKVQIARTAGTVGYWYTLSSGPAFPTIRAAEGTSSANIEFYVEPGRIYTVVSDGTHSWEYANKEDADLGTAGDWTAFDEGATNGFSFDCPSTGRVRLVPTGAVNFSITSK